MPDENFSKLEFCIRKKVIFKNIFYRGQKKGLRGIGPCKGEKDPNLHRSINKSHVPDFLTAPPGMLCWFLLCSSLAICDSSWSSSIPSSSVSQVPLISSVSSIKTKQIMTGTQYYVQKNETTPRKICKIEPKYHHIKYLIRFLIMWTWNDITVQLHVIKALDIDALSDKYVHPLIV